MKHTTRLQEIITGTPPGGATSAGNSHRARQPQGRRSGPRDDALGPKKGIRPGAREEGEAVRRPYPPWALCCGGCSCGWRYGGGIRVPRFLSKLLIVAEDKDANSTGFTLAPFFIRRELQARFGTIAEVL